MENNTIYTPSGNTTGLSANVYPEKNTEIQFGKDNYMVIDHLSETEVRFFLADTVIGLIPLS